MDTGFLVPFMPMLAMLPPSIAAIWIANRWFKSRGTTAELRGDIHALQEEVAALRALQGEAQERLDFAERILAQVREGHRELPKPSS